MASSVRESVAWLKIIPELLFSAAVKSTGVPSVSTAVPLSAACATSAAARVSAASDCASIPRISPLSWATEQACPGEP